MAYIESYELTSSTTGATSFVVTLPDHVVNDVLVVCVTEDATYTHSVTGWTQIGTTQQGTGITSSMWYKKAASSSETCTITCSGADAIHVHTLCLKDVDTTTQLDASSTTNSAAASQFSLASITTNTADCLLIYYVGADGIATAVHSDPGPYMFLNSSDNGGTTATTSAAGAVGWYYQRAVGSTPTPSLTASASIATTRFIAAFRNKSGGIIPPYIDDVTSPGTMLAVGHHFSALNGISFPASLSLTNIGPGGTGKATSYDAAAAVADYGINPYSNALSSTPPATAATSAAGFQIDFGAAKDLSSGFVMGSVIAANPKMANYNHGSVKQGGTYIAFADVSNNYRSYQVLAKDARPNTEGRAVYSVKVNQNITSYGSSGALDSSAITKMLFLSNNPTATITLYSAEIHKTNTQVISGGDSNIPVDSEGVAQVGSSFRLPVIQKIGAAGLLAYVPIQIGGGDAINFQIDAGALLFPRQSSISKKELNYHGDNNAIGISYAGKSGDVIKHTNSVITSPSPYYWEINSAATNAATWDFNGLTIVGANATFRNVTTFSGLVLSSCPTITISGCTLDNCTISKVPISNNTLVTDSSSIVSNSIVNISTLLAGNYWCSVPNPTIFTNNSFIGGGGHAIRITSGGSYNFVGNIFTSFGTDASTGAAIFNDSTSSVILNVSGGGSSPTVKNGLGASTTVNNTKTLTLTGLISGSDIVILTAGTETERVNVDQNVGTTYQFIYTYTASDYIDVGVFKATYVPFYVRTYLLPNSDASLPINQVLDRAYTP